MRVLASSYIGKQRNLLFGAPLFFHSLLATTTTSGYAAMPKESAFAKAKVKKQGGGFGASKADRFAMPKESWEDGPSSSSYAYDANSIGANLKRNQQRSKLVKSINPKAGGGFGSSSKKDSTFDKVRVGADAPGPGSYADGVNAVKSTFGDASKKRTGTSVGAFGTSGKQHELGAFASSISPAPGTYNADRDSISSTASTMKSKFQAKSKAFGGTKRFEPEAELVQADYDAHKGMAEEALEKASNLRAKGGFGSVAPRGEAISGQRSDAPGPGSYDWGKLAPSAFSTNDGPSSAFASKSQQHVLIEEGADLVPGIGEYDTSAGLEATDKYGKKSFNAATLGVGQTSAGFGSSAVSRADKKVEATPGPGEYQVTHKSDVKGLSGAQLPSAIFASASKKEADRLFPSHGSFGTASYLPPGGIAEITAKSFNKSQGHTFGGGARLIDLNGNGFEEIKEHELSA